MEKDTITTTRRIQLIIDSPEKETIGQVYKTLYDWQHICFRAANFIVTHYFIQEQIKSLFYLTEETKVKLADIAKDEAGILNTSRMNSFYRMLSEKFKGHIPTGILSALNNTLFSTLNKESSAYWKGEKSLRNYRKSIPIPIQAKDIRHIAATEDGRNFRFTIYALPFRTYFGKDIFDKRGMFENAQNGIIKLCNSSIQLKKNKIFLLATFQWSKAKEDLDDTIVAEASLSLEYPIVVAIGKYKYQVGNKEEFLYRRLAIQAALHRMQKAATYNKGGKGRQKKLKPIEAFKDKEKAYVDYKLHVYSRRLIDLCLKHHAATLLLTGQEEKEEAAGEDAFLLRNWSYYGLKQKIEYKAQRVGIEVIVE